MNGLDLFSGIGGLGLALKQYVRTVAYCEIDRYAQGVLLSRMRSGDIDTAPICDDVRALKAEMLPKIDIIFGGFPCQDISVAGRGVGLGGERSGLFFEIIRLTKEVKPHFVFLENVPAIRTRGLRQVVGAFANLRYDCRWTRVSAQEIGAPHLRKRWFLLAHAERTNIRHEPRWGGWSRGESAPFVRNNGSQESLANAHIKNVERQWQKSGRAQESNKDITSFDWWAIEPNVDRVAHGVSNRVDRIKCLGNAVVPFQAKEAFERLIGINPQRANDEHDQ